MGKLSVVQGSALKWFCGQGLIPQLSTHPVYYFIDKETKQEEKHHIDHIVEGYKEYKKEAARERARARRMEKK